MSTNIFENEVDSKIDIKNIQAKLSTEVIGQNIVYFDELDSTNTYCRQHGHDHADGTLVIAGCQTAGKGSRGRSWESPKDDTIAMSLILKPNMEPIYAPRLTPVMALSVARALDGLLQKAASVKIKWPNDIVLNGKKLVGILTEMSVKSAGIEQIVVGVGINVSETYFSKEIPHATSLYLETGTHFSREEIIASVMNCFEEDYKAFMETCDLSQLLEQYIQFSTTVGNEVRILDGKGEYKGRAMDVDANGQLLVRKEDGQVVKVFADEVSVRGVYGYV